GPDGIPALVRLPPRLLPRRQACPPARLAHRCAPAGRLPPRRHRLCPRHRHLPQVRDPRMLRPKPPTMPTPSRPTIRPAVVEPTAVEQHPPTVAATAPAPAAGAGRPVVQLTPGAALVLVGGGTAVV